MNAAIQCPYGASEQYYFNVGVSFGLFHASDIPTQHHFDQTLEKVREGIAKAVKEVKNQQAGKVKASTGSSYWGSYKSHVVSGYTVYEMKLAQVPIAGEPIVSWLSRG